jgi:hypothetical protein
MSAFVYQLVPKNPEDINERYIGSTTSLKRRINTHYDQANNNPDLCKSSILINKYGRDQVKFEILETCQEGVNIREREQHYLDALPNMNGMPAYKNREQKLELRKAINARYRENQMYEVDCECGGKYMYANRHCHWKSKRHIKYEEEHPQLSV